jgi:UDP-N-acetylmuramoyl-tripeptide--D-alanyl-D-alanine ligase
MNFKQKCLEKLRWVLKNLAKLTLWRYGPVVIAITGSVGKTSTKLAIANVLSSLHSVRVSKHNYNNEIGVPFTIISEREKVGGIIFWLGVIFVAVLRVIVKGRY